MVPIPGSSILNIMTGTISGKDGGEADVGSLDGDNLTVLIDRKWWK